MSYKDLTNVDMINGRPADLNVIEESLLNQDYFKQQHDQDEDLANVIENILPSVDQTYNLGSPVLKWLVAYVATVAADAVALGDGTESSPSLTFENDLSTGFYRTLSGDLAFVSSQMDRFYLGGWGAKLKANNSTQLHLESEEVGQEGTWTLGANAEGFKVTHPASSLNPRFQVHQTQAETFVPHVFSLGDNVAPSITFREKGATGFYASNAANAFTAMADGNDLVRFNSANVEFETNKVLFKEGALGAPSIAFSSYPLTGLYSERNDHIGMQLNGFESLNVNSNNLMMSGTDIAITARVLADDNKRPAIELLRGRGVFGTPTAAQTGDLIGEIRAEGLVSWDGTDETYSDTSSAIRFKAEENFRAVGTGSSVEIRATKVGEVTSRPIVSFGENSKSDTEFKGSVGHAPSLLVGPATLNNIPVDGVSLLLLDSSAGDLDIRGFSGGVDGQVLKLAKVSSQNHSYLRQNNVNGDQKLMLGDGVSDYDIGLGFGGIELVHYSGAWYEISRS